MRNSGALDKVGGAAQGVVSAGANTLRQVGSAVGKGVEAVAGGINRLQEAGSAVGKGVEAVAGGINRLQEAGAAAVDKGAELLSGARERLLGPYKPNDGVIVGKGGQTYAPGTPLSQVTPTPSVPQTQADGTKPPTVIYVNGIKTDRAGHEGNIDALARAGHNVIGIHNETYNIGVDVLEAARDKAGLGNTPAVHTLSNTVLTELRAGRDVHLVGHSQGGEITSRALYDARDQLIQEGRSPQDVEALFRKHVDVETYGSAGHSYPNGPEYVHYINEQDPVPHLGGTDGVLAENLGRDAAVRIIPSDARIPNFDDHGFDRYLESHVPFEVARRTFPRAN